MEPLNKAASAPQGASKILMRPESRESERPLFREALKNTTPTSEERDALEIVEGAIPTSSEPP